MDYSGCNGVSEGSEPSIEGNGHDRNQVHQSETAVEEVREEMTTLQISGTAGEDTNLPGQAVPMSSAGLPAEQSDAGGLMHQGLVPQSFSFGESAMTNAEHVNVFNTQSQHQSAVWQHYVPGPAGPIPMEHASFPYETSFAQATMHQGNIPPNPVNPTEARLTNGDIENGYNARSEIPAYLGTPGSQDFSGALNSSAPPWWIQGSDQGNDVDLDSELEEGEIRE